MRPCSPFRSLQQQQTTVSEELIGAQKRVADATTMIQTLCREARCDQPDKLPEVENRDRKRRQLREEKEALEDRLCQLSAGATVEAFVDQAAAAETEHIAADRLQLTQVIFFTHHQHMVALARQSIDEQVFQVHRL